MGGNMMDWDERYREPGYAYGTIPNDFIVAVSERIPRGRVLSLAEGEGRNAVYLATLGCTVTAVDSSAVGLRKAEAWAAERNVAITTVVADLANFKIEPEKWDGIVSCYCHVPSSIRAPLHQAVVRGLKPGGVFVLEAFSKEQLAYDSGGPKDIDMLMSLDDLKNELAGLEFIRAATLERDVREGTRHTGLASVVQIFAVKPA
ncbi:SAM-dependent methyltransferase [Geobacter argillaceus]|uniref:Methyltransferase family protein n=1 Tax=Geobacter argillaceus TaxID=345631 RepID=A0A562VFI0_9BACT|nr:class I SAM-dependent methyltransferase [Geobacter argillaceus]TWJ16561.1 methyltransferase family protein [Geobacter argillaceus]